MIKITIQNMTIEIPEGHGIIESFLGGVAQSGSVSAEGFRTVGENIPEKESLADTAPAEAVQKAEADELAAKKRSDAAKKAAETKAANKAAEAKAEAPPAAQGTPPVAAEAAGEETLTLDQVRVILGELQSTGRVIAPLITQLGAKNLTTMDPALYPEIIRLARALPEPAKA